MLQYDKVITRAKVGDNDTRLLDAVIITDTCDKKEFYITTYENDILIYNTSFKCVALISNDKSRSMMKKAIALTATLARL